MEIEIVARGVLLGLAVAAPVGPIGVLVIRRSVERGASLGLATGLGAAVADAGYAAIAALGISVGPEGLTSSPAFRIASAALLVWLGVRTLRARDERASTEAPLGAAGHGSAFASTIALTLANPATIASFAAASAAIGVPARPGAALTFALSVLLGSSAWWLSLSLGTAAIRSRLGARPLRAIRVGSGIMLLGFAVMALVR